MSDRPHQAELPLTRDDREAHAVYKRCPPAKAGEPRPEGYWPGLLVELRGAYGPDRARNR